MSEGSAPRTTANRDARGVVPNQPDDPVLKSPYAHGVLFFARLRPDLDREGLEAWLTKTEAHIQALRAETGDAGQRVATVALGFGPSLFTDPQTGQPRFTEVQPPAGFAQLPAVGQGAPVGADVVFYLVATAEAAITRFLSAVADPADMPWIAMESGFKSWPDRDVFGYRDGLRNAQENRNDVVFVDADCNPDEPAWAVRGTYMAYLRVTENITSFVALTPEDQDKVIGRDRDGRRLDLLAGENPAAEGPFTGDTPPGCSHVRKAGPRGEHQDAVEIFRRGMRFYEVTSDAQLVQGLQFVSFQASLDQFDTIFNRWMLNPAFPEATTGADALFAKGHAAVDKWGFFFVPPDVDGPTGSGMLEPPPTKRPTKTGRVAVRKKVLDSAGNPARGELGGFTFQVVDANGTPVGQPFTTNSAGHALSEEIPAGDYQLTETPLPGFAALSPQPFTLRNGQVLVPVTNTAAPGNTGY